MEIHLDPKTYRMLLADWFIRLGREAGMEFKQRQSDKQGLTLGATSEFHVVAHFTEVTPYLTFTPSDAARKNDVNIVVAEAVRRVERGDYGGVVWYSDVLSEPTFGFSPFASMGWPMERLGSQQRILGWRRLGGNILLEFVEEKPEGTTGQGPIAPRATVHVHIAAPGPCQGYLSSQIANDLIETVAATCTFALGRPVNFPHTIFPSKEESVASLTARQADPTIGKLARKGIPLDTLKFFAVSGGAQVFQRARAALLTFDAATRQDRDSVAAVLSVIAAECLMTPNAL